MAIAHVCFTCGTDLARVRALKEPHYGLPIVTCPGCNKVHVRRRQPLAVLFRRVRSLDWALTVLVFNTLAAAACTFAVTMFVTMFLMTTLDRRPLEIWEELGPAVITGLIVVPIILGTWLRAGIGHVRVRHAWPAFGAWLLLWLTVVVAMMALQEADVWSAGVPSGLNEPVILTISGDAYNASQLRGVAAEGARTWTRGAALIYIIMLVALIGIIPGRGVAAALQLGRRSILRMRRRRRRRDRNT